MILLTGTYADDCNGELPDMEATFKCRVFTVNGRQFCNGVGEPVAVQDGDVLKVCGNGSWFALFRPITDDEAVVGIDGNSYKEGDIEASYLSAIPVVPEPGEKKPELKFYPRRPNA